MSCSCIKGTDSKFDFKLESLDCSTLIFTDLSSWMDDDNYSIPNKHEISVTLPMSNKVIHLDINAGSSTVIKGPNLGVGECIPDGIYCFTIDSCGIKYTRNSAVTCQLECRLDELKVRLAKEEISLEKVNELQSYLDIIKSSAKNGQPKKAIEFHKVLNKKLDNLNCECNCK